MPIRAYDLNRAASPTALPSNMSPEATALLALAFYLSWWAIAKLRGCGQSWVSWSEPDTTISELLTGLFFAAVFLSLVIWLELALMRMD